MRRLTPDEATREPWVVFADIVLAALFLFVLFIFAQYIRYEKLVLQEELERRKAEVARLIRDSVPERDSVAIDSGEAFSQRIRFSSDLLFRSCRDSLIPAGHDVVIAVGRLLSRRASYFESIEVEGHTDPQQPTGTDQCPPEDNWELSSGRAATVVRILARDVALEPARLSAVGRAQFQPPDSGVVNFALQQPPGSEAAFRQMRRIELVLRYSEEDIRESLRADQAPEAADGSIDRD